MEVKLRHMAVANDKVRTGVFKHLGRFQVTPSVFFRYQIIILNLHFASEYELSVGYLQTSVITMTNYAICVLRQEQI